MITNALRGKPYTNPIKEWAVKVHDLSYEYGDYAYEVERVLKKIRKSEADRFMLLFREEHKKEKLIDALYYAANLTLAQRK